MSSTPKSLKNKNKISPYWGETPVLTHEQTIEWLDGFRQLMFEVWRNNPDQIPREKRTWLKEWLSKSAVSPAK